MTATARTWSEDFPISQTIPVSSSSQTLTINQSGSPDGYLLYDGQGATIDVNNDHDHDIEVNASYVIIRGLNLRGASRHGIRIYPPSHDVVIEECDISGWGQQGSDRHSAILAYESGSRDPVNTTINRIIIQRNRMHHPRSDSNDWSSGHPGGPQAVTFLGAGTNHVIRYN